MLHINDVAEVLIGKACTKVMACPDTDCGLKLEFEDGTKLSIGYFSRQGVSELNGIGINDICRHGGE